MHMMLMPKKASAGLEFGNLWGVLRAWGPDLNPIPAHACVRQPKTLWPSLEATNMKHFILGGIFAYLAGVFSLN